MTPLTVGELRLTLIGLPDEAHIWSQVSTPGRAMATKVTGAAWDDEMGALHLVADVGPT